MRLPSKPALIASVAIPILSLALLEVGGGIYERRHPGLPVDVGNGFVRDSRVFVPRAQGSRDFVTAAGKRRSFQYQSFPIEKKGGFRIVALGESSVNRLQAEFGPLALRLTRTLEPRYGPFEIINAGGNSYGSQRLLLVASEMLDYSPDMLLIYMGHNEFEEVEQLEFTHLESLSLQEIASKSAAIRVLRDLLLRRKIEELTRSHAYRLLPESPDVGRAWAYPFNQADDDERMRRFQANLTTIVGMYRQRGIPVVIGTVPSNLVRPYLPPGPAAERFGEVRALLQEERYPQADRLSRKILREALGRHQSSDKENAVIRRIAGRFDLPLADVESAIARDEPHHIPGETLFSDHCHLNDAGNKVLIRVFEKRILATLKTGPDR